MVNFLGYFEETFYGMSRRIILKAVAENLRAECLRDVAKNTLQMFGREF